MQVVQAANKAGEQAMFAVRETRGKEQKKLRAMRVGRTVGPDDLKRAHDQMEKIAQKGQADVKSILDAAKKVLEQA